ncbi:Transcription termination factor like [Actinidia chinensis var. chinensis]|uniref:Transcription termination factor like n=1 Tax=Actinidia chinensis var. chinensis TaxID=1590841 RepID=A0A2R6P4C7_ACTCC|nr:Transcription termination factor like [Actinidia chinensis var. chinensis]
MFKFISKSLHHVRSDVRASPFHNLCFIQFHAFSSSLKPIKKYPNQHSFTVSYLINSCGFSPEKALSASKYVKFETADKPNSVLKFLKSQGFPKTQISSIIRIYPSLLLCDPKKTLLPKLEFLKSKGVSRTDIIRIVCTSPTILKRSLDKIVSPSFDFFRNLFQSEEKTLTAIKSYGGLLLFDRQTHVKPNIETLREAGVPNANIMFLLTNQPRAFMASSDRFGMIVKEVEKMGFDPLTMNFVLAIFALRKMTKSTWEKKVEVYKKWGWSEDEILAAFKLRPWCMTVSEDKINGVMDFLVNKMGLDSSFVARRPKLISLSLEKRIVPRCAVYQVLLSKGLIKSNGISLSTLLQSPEKCFLEKVVDKHKEETPDLLKLYKKKLDLAK